MPQSAREKKTTSGALQAPFYSEYIFRKLKLGGYMRRQITEARLLARFKKLFDGPESTIVAIGDFDQRKHRKHHEPVKGKGFRTLFRKAGYDVYLVDEFRTSCRCSACGGECKTFRACENPRPYRTGSVLRHGLVQVRDLLEALERGHERRVQHMEDSHERDSRRIAPGLPPTSQSLTQW